MVMTVISLTITLCIIVAVGQASTTRNISCNVPSSSRPRCHVTPALGPGRPSCKKPAPELRCLADAVSSRKTVPCSNPRVDRGTQGQEEVSSRIYRLSRELSTRRRDRTTDSKVDLTFPGNPVQIRSEKFPSGDEPHQPLKSMVFGTNDLQYRALGPSEQVHSGAAVITNVRVPHFYLSNMPQNDMGKCNRNYPQPVANDSLGCFLRFIMGYFREQRPVLKDTWLFHVIWGSGLYPRARNSGL